MRKKSATKKKREDAVWDQDWGKAVEESKSALVGRPSMATSIKLEPDLIAELKKKGAKRGLPYQTMLKMIVRENIAKY